jgi:predicted ATPase
VLAVQARLKRMALRDDVPTKGFPYELPAVKHLGKVQFHERVTFIVGDNGMGKSTLVEALAIVAGFPPEGGSRSGVRESDPTVSELCKYVRLTWENARPSWGWFLRAESFFNVATYLAESGRDFPSRRGATWNFHGMSHGESFLQLALERFGQAGFFVMDEPEAALSINGCFKLMRLIDHACDAGAQFVIATHSPILMAYPSASIYQLDRDDIRKVAYNDVFSVDLWRRFLADPQKYVREVLADDD